MRVLAVDGGNSKTDVMLVDTDGRLLGALRGPTTSHQAVGLEDGMDRLATLITRVLDAAGEGAMPEVGSYALAGADTPTDIEALSAAIAERGFGRRTTLTNDGFGALRAGTDEGWGVAVICGAGVNAVGLAPDGRTARLAALGQISGDWGGGNDIGWAGLAAAVRAVDGRGPATRLSLDVPAHFGQPDPASVTAAMYRGAIGDGRIGELSPVVLAAAGSGDEVARGIVERMADEVVAMAGAMIGQLRLHEQAPVVVLAGGVFRTSDTDFFERIAAGVEAVAPGARVTRLDAPPVAGAALLGLDALVSDRPTRDRIGARIREQARHWDATLGGR